MHMAYKYKGPDRGTAGSLNIFSLSVSELFVLKYGIVLLLFLRYQVCYKKETSRLFWETDRKTARHSSEVFSSAN